MKIKDSFSGLIEFFKEFSKVKSGLIGIFIILIFLILMILEPVILPYKETNEKWRDISYWQDNPSNAAPVWTQLFSKEKKPPTKFIYKYEQSTGESSGLTTINYTFDYKFKYTEAPQNLIVHAKINGYVGYQIFFERPDGISFEIYRSAQNFADEAIRFTADTDSRSVTYDFAKKYETEDTLLYVDPKDVNVLQVLFSKTENGPISHPEPLHGDYKIHIKVTYLDPSATFDEPYMVLTGRVSGLLGTDNAKRDLFSGIIAGIKWAFLIGMLVAVISVFVGLFWGVTSTYFGGAIDEVMNRIYEFFINLPMLPILISISAVFKIRMAILIPLLCLFSWAGSVRTVRAISLQLKEEVFIEASKAL